ncbi:MAG: stage 0 sporulation family protein [Candidatus Omnitrophota bacterium]|nr:stage 0 sporulation family protein [Candidatus Omnitrophota bacterium]MDZ4241820.1 stage 0 sporulation family protein [Candidatus Omnitrophota bacterium]
MGKIIEVKVGEYRPVQVFDLNDIPCDRDDHVVVEVDRGTEFGRVVSHEKAACEGKTEASVGKVLRKATEGDMNQVANNRIKAQDAINICLRKINERKLDMNIIKAEYTFDCSKIIFFFLSEGRVDFRNLVKDLAKIFRVRIELKQVGVRDKAKIVGGFGVCGRELCCSSYMKNFHALSIKMAKEQELPLNPSRISGVCGRIKCCMAYEFSVYRELAREMPRPGDKVTTPEGKGRVKDINILKQYVIVDLGEGKTVKLSYSSPQPASVSA